MQYAMYQPYDFIVTQGELGSEVYFLIDGTAHLVKNDHQKIEILAILQQGDFFGENSLLNICQR